MGFSNMMIQAARSMPKSTMTQSIPSLTYSSCSTTNMWWLKNCWSFSLTKLMEICSKPLYSKISKPAMSRTAQKLFFIDKVDGDLFKAIVLKDLKTSNVEDSAEVVFLHGGVNKCFITLDDEPLEETIKGAPSNTTDTAGSLVASLTLGNPFITNLDLGLTESFQKCVWVNTKAGANLVGVGHISSLSLVITTLLNELNCTRRHDTSSDLVAIPFLLVGKSNDVKGCIRHL